jgi:copper ion binding protein
MKNIIALLMIAFFAASCSGSADQAKVPAAATAAAIKAVSLQVKGMSCTGCEETIKETVQKIDGVTECKASFETGKADVKFDTTKTNAKTISDAIVAAGYEVSSEVK